MPRTGRATSSVPLFTVAVFQDAPWASRGVAALLADRFAPSSISVIALATPEVDELVSRVLSLAVAHTHIKSVGLSVAVGPLIPVLQGDDAGLATAGLAGTCRRAGFQSHDGRIFELLTMRGGILTAVRSEARAADALARFHAYGGGNAAIGAWTGRV
jgi:hypothetical protein